MYDGCSVWQQSRPLACTSTEAAGLSSRGLSSLVLCRVLPGTRAGTMRSSSLRAKQLWGQAAEQPHQEHKSPMDKAGVAPVQCMAVLLWALIY